MAGLDSVCAGNDSQPSCTTIYRATRWMVAITVCFGCPLQ